MEIWGFKAKKGRDMGHPPPIYILKVKQYIPKIKVGYVVFTWMCLLCAASMISLQLKYTGVLGEAFNKKTVKLGNLSLIAREPPTLAS